MYLDNATWLSLVRYGFAIDKFPLLPCPTCFKVGLRPVKNAFQKMMLAKNFDVSAVKMPAASAGLGEVLLKVAEGYGEMTAKRSRFVCFLICSCGEPVTFMGNAKVVYGNSEDLPKLSTTSFLPSIPIFELLPIYPLKVRKELEKSFNAFFSDPAGAGGRVRTAIEYLLDEQGVQQCRVDKAGQVQLGRDGLPNKLGLGERLKIFSDLYPELGQMLGGVKQLGNEATHGQDLPHEDLLDAYSLLEHVLDELYVSRAQRSKLLEQSKTMTMKFK